MHLGVTAPKELTPRQLEAFYTDVFRDRQFRHFVALTTGRPIRPGVIVDVGGGIGEFASHLSGYLDKAVRVIDSDPRAIRECESRDDPNITAQLGNATTVSPHGDESAVCFNLVLHHLVGTSDTQTRALQKRALQCWAPQVDYIFVNEYVYDSFIDGVSGRLIYAITASETLSRFASLVGTLVPSLKANTCGVGVRFRGHNEWVRFFEECGFDVVDSLYSEPDPIPLLRRLLLIREVRTDSFLLRPRRGTAEVVA